MSNFERASANANAAKYIQRTSQARDEREFTLDVWAGAIFERVKIVFMRSIMYFVYSVVYKIALMDTARNMFVCVIVG